MPWAVGSEIKADNHIARLNRSDWILIIINNNPETVSTDFDTSDRLYFDPLTLESVSEVLLRERAHGILLQFGGQTAINLALPLAGNMPHLSTLGLHLVMEGTQRTR